MKRRMDKGERIRAEMDGWGTTDGMMMDVVQSGSSSNSRITWIVVVCVKNCLRWMKTRRGCQPLQKEEKGYHKGILWLSWKIILLLYNNNSNNWRRSNTSTIHTEAVVIERKSEGFGFRRSMERKGRILYVY